MLEASVAIDDKVSRNTPLTFRVLGDGKVLWKSAPVEAKGQPQACKVGVRGIDKLELFVDCPGESPGAAHAVWVEPRLHR